MNIDKEKCIACKTCYPYCTVGAISMVTWDGGKKSEVNQEQCVECGACLRSEVCPKDAIFMPELTWPREIRPYFANPYAGHWPGKEGAKPPPEIKLNDITGRIQEGMTAVVIEVGRPGMSTTFLEVQKVCRALAGAGVEFDPGGPLTSLMEDPRTGKIREDILDERCLHVFIHFSVDDDTLRESLAALREVSGQIETVFSVGLSNRVGNEGTIPTLEIVHEMGLTELPQAKTNVGLGRLMGGGR